MLRDQGLVNGGLEQSNLCRSKAIGQSTFLHKKNSSKASPEDLKGMIKWWFSQRAAKRGLEWLHLGVLALLGLLKRQTDCLI